MVLLERNHWLGGKAAVLEAHGYRFDKGPTILTMPSVLRRIFSEAGQQLEDHLELIRLDPQWRCLFGDGSVLDLRQSGETMADSLANFSPQTGSAEGYRRFLAASPPRAAFERDLTTVFFWRLRRFRVLGHHQFEEHAPAVVAFTGGLFLTCIRVGQ